MFGNVLAGGGTLSIRIWNATKNRSPKFQRQRQLAGCVACLDAFYYEKKE
jgi:hypothetical protein